MTGPKQFPNDGGISMQLLFPFCVLLADAGQLVTLRFFFPENTANKTAMEVQPGSTVH